MPQWKNSKWKEPKNWRSIRRRILRRDPICTWSDEHGRCKKPATEVDHIERNGGESESNLRGLCSSHHATRSGRQGAFALQQKIAENHKRFDFREKHPGMP